MKKQKKSHKKASIILLVLAILVVGGLVGGWAYKKHQDNASNASATAANQQKEAEKQDVNDNKASLEDNPATTTPDANKDGSTTPATPTITVYITDASSANGSAQVSSYVSGVFEDGGTCTLTLTKGSQTVTRTSQGLSDSNHTTCPTFNITNSDHATLAAGTWTAVVSYSSQTHSGKSASKTFEVQ